MFKQITDSPDQVISGYVQAGIDPLAWIIAPRKDPVCGYVREVRGSFIISAKNNRLAEVTSIKISLLGGGEMEIDTTGLSPYRMPDPAKHLFGMLGFFENAPPDNKEIVRMGMSIAQKDEWRLIHAFEWTELVDAAREGEFRPEGVPEREGFRWRPLKPVFNSQTEWLVYWGLVDLIAMVRDSQNGRENLKAAKFILTDTQGKPVEIKTGEDGRSAVVPIQIEKKRIFGSLGERINL